MASDRVSPDVTFVILMFVIALWTKSEGKTLWTDSEGNELWTGVID